VLLGVSLASAGCKWLVGSDEKIVPLAEPYALWSDYEGMSSLVYDGSWFKKPAGLLGEIDSTGITQTYLVTCQSEALKYYLLSLAAKDEQQAKASLIGPLNRIAFHHKLYQLTGDSTLRLSYVQ
jgi:hypothetical protein